jgi:hypothetical protein
MTDSVIVSRHPAAVAFVARQLGGRVGELKEGIGHPLRVYVPGPDGAVQIVPVVEEATADDVRGKVVYGNLPNHLACLAAAVVAVEFAGSPPRGREYGLADMIEAGARLARYGVLRLPDGATLGDYLHQGGFEL